MCPTSATADPRCTTCAHGAPPTPTGPEHPLASLRLLAPSAPTEVVCASGTYRAVIVELKKAWPTEPVIFLGPSTAVVGTGAAIRWPADARELTHEPELAIVISRRTTNVPPEEVDSRILGYTWANDVSAWDVLQRVTHFTRPKGYDTFCPVGPVVVKGDGFDPDDAGVPPSSTAPRRSTPAPRTWSSPCARSSASARA